MGRTLVTVSALSIALFGAAASAQTLAPHQQAALDAVLAAIEPAQRTAVRAQLEPMLALMDAATIDLMLASMAADRASEAEPVEPSVDSVATPEAKSSAYPTHRRTAATTSTSAP